MGVRECVSGLSCLVASANLFEEGASFSQLNVLVEISSYCEIDRCSRRGDKPYSTPRGYLSAAADMVRCFTSAARAAHPRVVVVESFVVCSEVSMEGPCCEQMV